MPEQEQQQEQTYYTMDGKKVPPNLVFEYRHVRHIGNPLTETYDQLVQRTVEKYRRIDAGLDPITGQPKPARLGNSYAAVQEISAIVKHTSPKLAGEANALAEENAILRNKLAEMQRMMLEMQKPPEPPPPPSEQARIDALGRGEEEPETVLHISDEAAGQDAQSPTDGDAAPQIEPETPKSTGAGDCPKCMKHFKRLDMHVCKAA